MSRRAGRRVRAGDEHPHQVPVRRVAELAAALELAREEARNVVARGVGDRAGVRLERLHEHASWRVPAAAARELGQQLEGPLLRAEVGVPEAGVGVDHRGQRDTREVVALGDHLRAHEHHALGVGKVAKRRRDCPGPPHRVRVEANPLELRHEPLELAFEPLRACAEPHHVR